MRGTIVCGVTETPEARAAAELAAALAARLDLRVVLVHTLQPSLAGAGVDLDDERQHAERMAKTLAHDVGATEARIVTGNRVDALAQVAADEGADVIVLGSRPRGARGRQLRCALARELEAVQGVPVLIAPPSTRRRTGRRLALAEAPADR